VDDFIKMTGLSKILRSGEESKVGDRINSFDKMVGSGDCALLELLGVVVVIAEKVEIDGALERNPAAQPLALFRKEFS
jgi:hypothetical protein